MRSPLPTPLKGRPLSCQKHSFAVLLPDMSVAMFCFHKLPHLPFALYAVDFLGLRCIQVGVYRGVFPTHLAAFFGPHPIGVRHFVAAQSWRGEGRERRDSSVPKLSPAARFGALLRFLHIALRRRVDTVQQTWLRVFHLLACRRSGILAHWRPLSGIKFALCNCWATTQTPSISWGVRFIYASQASAGMVGVRHLFLTG